MNIVVAQKVDELKYILKKIKNFQDYKILALDLDVLLYCKKKNLLIVDFFNLINNSEQRKILVASQKLLKQCNYGNLRLPSQKKVLNDFLRKKFYSAALVNLILDNLKKKFKIKKIYISGWKYDYTKIDFDYQLSNIILNFFPKQKIINLSNSNNNKKSSRKINYTFFIENIKSSPKKVFLITSLGYNIGRIILNCILKNYKLVVFNNKDLNLIKKFFFKICGITEIKFLKKKIKKQKNLNIGIKKIRFIFNKKNYSDYLNSLIEDFSYELKILNLKYNAINRFLENNKIDFIISTITRDIYGYFAEKGYELGIKSCCISHGTVAESFDQYDKIYKKIIQEAVFDGNFYFFSIQSKISNSVKIPITGRKLITGNLIFSNSSRRIRNKKKILYAVTYKSFNNLQLYGVEFFYEFFDNLQFLEKYSKINKASVIVQLHPNISNEIFQSLKNMFKYLIFKQGKIKYSLDESFVAISFSSSVIEDALMSNIPVILLDRWKRYKHCKSEINPKKLNQPIYYVDNEKNLSIVLNTIKNSKKIDFNKVSYGGTLNSNINNFFDKIHKIL